MCQQQQLCFIDTPTNLATAHSGFYIKKFGHMVVFFVFSSNVSLFQVFRQNNIGYQDSTFWSISKYWQTVTYCYWLILDGLDRVYCRLIQCNIQTLDCPWHYINITDNNITRFVYKSGTGHSLTPILILVLLMNLH